ncbi:MAG: ABC transporter permease [Neomegalonema sp.]|nr:ABC transporter permease [Neomegalonema sp.]
MMLNVTSIWAIYRREMKRAFGTLVQTILSPVLTTSLYFIVFGSAIGSHIGKIDGVDYGAFLVPGLIMLTVLQQSVANASFGIYFPRFTGSIYEVLSAPISYWEVLIGYVGAAATKAMILALLILATSAFFVPLRIEYPLVMVLFLVLTCVTFSMLGFLIGILAGNWEQLQMAPLIIITPLVFLGGAFYELKMLPPFWQNVSLFNPVLYLVSGFRWSFYGAGDVPIAASLGMITLFMAICIVAVWRIFATGYRLKP